MTIFEHLVPSYFEVDGLEIIVLQDKFGNCLNIRVNNYE